MEISIQNELEKITRAELQSELAYERTSSSQKRVCF